MDTSQPIPAAPSPDLSAAPLAPQTADQLTAEFGMPEILGFGLRGDLLCAEIRTDAAEATVALQGAHIVNWRPAGQEAALFLSRRSEFITGKAIRGGVPVIWPWFGPRTAAVNAAPPGAPKSASHGIARTAVWQLAFAALAGDDLHLSFTLAPSSESRALGFDGFRLAYEVVVGRALTMRLTVANDGPEPLRFEEALHSYLAVSEVEQAALRGLADTDFLDKRDNSQRKRESSEPLVLEQTTDRVYLDTETTCTVTDDGLARVLQISKGHSRNTVVWNPWAELTRDLADMEPDGWHEMLCVETANVGDAAVTLAPGTAHTMTATIAVLPIETAGDTGANSDTGAAAQEPRP